MTDRRPVGETSDALRGVPGKLEDSAHVPIPHKGIFLRSSIVHRPVSMHGSHVDTHLAQLGVAARPLPTEKIQHLYQEIRENILALMNVEKSTHAKMEEAKLLRVFFRT